MKTAHISDTHGSMKNQATIHNPSLKKHKKIVAAAVMDSFSSKDSVLLLLLLPSDHLPIYTNHVPQILTS